MLKEGTIVGQRYEIISRVGGGGMADVYKAKDHKLNRMVAVKVMKAEFKEDPTFITKFRKEAQAAAGLSHPNIVNVYDVGDDNGLYYIVMELVEGITLKDYITRKGKLSVKESTSIAIQVSLGLQAAHNRGIIHRDVKPQNIIISTDGKVKLSDFGIAKATNSNTITSNVMGSVHYSSPEQVRGGFSNAKSDIYSLGVTLYEMVTGKVPFDGETTVAIAIKHLQEEIEAPSKYTPNLPYSLEQIILKCTQKSPERRYNNMAELIEDLKHSLIDPQGNFVALTPLSAHAQTVMMSPDEMESIRNSSPAEEDAQQYRYEEEAEDEEDYEETDDTEDNYDDYDDEDDEDESSGLEKAITIGGFIVAAIIIAILIYFIARAAGLVGGGSTDSSASVTPTPTVTASSSNNDKSTSEPDTTTKPEVTTKPEANKVKVPDLKNKTKEEAENLLHTLKLGGKYDGEEASDSVDAGRVCYQSVAAGEEVEENTTILYKISSGKGNVTIPSEGVINKSQQEATVKLSELGLTVSDTVNKENSDSVPIGSVISTNPAAGTEVAAGTEITLTVSTGPKQDEETKKVTVPNYIGLTQADAQASLEKKGLKVEIAYGSSNAYNKGDVIKQNPVGNSEVPKGSTVVLTINEPEKSSGTQSGGDGQKTDNNGTWTCTKELQEPSSYNGGKVKIELIQKVNGEEKVTTVYSGENPWANGKYSPTITGASGVATGTIRVTEEGGSSWEYKNVPFTES